MYALAYEGLGMYDNIITMFLPYFSDHGNGALIRALQKVYTREEINAHLKIAEQSIVCVVDTFQSSAFLIENYGEKNEVSTELKYTSGTAKMTLFGIQVTMATPDLKDDETVSRERFVNEFKESAFYTALLNYQ